MFEVCRTYYDSPREDCSGYYYDIYEYPTAKAAYKAAQHWCRTNEPESGDVCLRSGKPRLYDIGLSIKKPDGTVETHSWAKTTDYGHFEETRKQLNEMLAIMRKNPDTREAFAETVVKKYIIIK